MPRDTTPAAAAPETFASPPPAKPAPKPEPAPKAEEPNKAPFVPVYFVGSKTTGEGEAAKTERVVFVTTEAGEPKVVAPTEKAPAEAWAELLGHTNPGEPYIRNALGRIIGERRFAMSDFKRHIYEAARIQWGHGEGDSWAPGAIGKEMTLEEYQGFVKKGQGAVGR